MKYETLRTTVTVEEQVDEPKEVETPDGTRTAEEGDVIVVGVEGDRRPISPERFAKTHIPADADDGGAFLFYDDVLPEGVSVYTEERGEGRVVPTGVTVEQGRLPPDAKRRAEEFAREFSNAVVHLGDPNLGGYSGGDA